MSRRRGQLPALPHPAVICSGPQLLSVIEAMEAGAYPLPGVAVWRPDLPRDVAVRLALATGATAAMIRDAEARPGGQA